MTRTEIENYIVYVQDKVTEIYSKYLTDIANGKCTKYPSDNITFVMIGQEILYDYYPDNDNNCVTEEQLCNIIAMIQTILK